MNPCTKFTALVNGGDFRGTYCCTCGEKEKNHPDDFEDLSQPAALEALDSAIAELLGE